MPEQVTKYPEVTLKVLEGAGARCGEGLPQQILTECPEERFCSLPSGEICVYGIDEIPRMTQVTTAEVARVVCPGGSAPAAGSAISTLEGLLVAGALVLGLVVGGVSGRRLGRRR